MQREDSAEATAAAGEIVEVQEEVRPAISLEDLVEATPGPRHAADAAAPNAGTAANAAPGLRVARVVSVTGRRARIGLRNKGIEIDATLAEDVQRELIEDAVREKAGVLVEIEENGEAVIVGVVQTRKPSEVRVTGEKIVVEGEREVLLRAGRAALRLREDGDVELVGSRISAASRGLFRIVGRILRLN